MIPEISVTNGPSILSALDAIGIKEDHPVLVVVGWAKGSPHRDIVDHVNLMLRREVLPAAEENSAVIVTGGTDAGIMAMVGQLSHRHESLRLVGVAPWSLVAKGSTDGTRAEPSHQLITTPGDEWGDEGPFLVDLAEQIAGNRSVTVLSVGGGTGTTRELDLARRRGWPTLVVTGVDGASATDAYATTHGAVPLVPPQPPTAMVPTRDPLVRVDISERRAVGRALRWALSDDDLLKDAWTRYAVADAEAIARKPPAKRLAGLVLLLAVSTAIAALGMLALTAWDLGGSTSRTVLKSAVTTLSVTAAALLAFLERETRVRAWVDIRAAAESVLQAIYLYRAGAGEFKDAANPQSVLSKTIHRVDDATSGRFLRTTFTKGPTRMASLLAGSSTMPWPLPGVLSRVPDCDNLVGRLSAAAYDEARVVDQIRNFEDTSRSYLHSATTLTAWIFAMSAATAGLLAASWHTGELGVIAAALAAGVAAIVSWREYAGYEPLSESRDTTATLLRAARGRWLSRSSKDDGLRRYVREVEQVLAGEGTDWARLTRQVHQSWLERYRRR